MGSLIGLVKPVKIANHCLFSAGDGPKNRISRSAQAELHVRWLRFRQRRRQQELGQQVDGAKTGEWSFLVSPIALPGPNLKEIRTLACYDEVYVAND